MAHFSKLAAIALASLTGAASLSDFSLYSLMPMARTCFDVLDGILGDQPYFGGDRISIADIMLAAQLDLLSETGEGRELISGTRLEAWLKRMVARPSFAATQPPAFLREAA